MKIKSLLIGSAALMTVSTGSYAADAVVMAAPEPVEYVRVCDVYGPGFFYIPGTETCLAIRGYIRDDINFNLTPTLAAPVTGYWNRARLATSFDARSETEWGTLRGYGEVEFNYLAGANIPVSALPAALGPAPATVVNVLKAFIDIQGASGSFRIGRDENPYARFLGYGASNMTNTGSYGYENQAEISYTFNGGNGFSGIIALVENKTHAAGVVGPWATNVEGGINFAQGWGSIGAIVGYDGWNGEWGTKAVARFKGSNGFSGGLHVFYASSNNGLATSAGNDYRVAGLGATSIVYQQNWSVLGHVSFQASPKVNLSGFVQWFDAPVFGGGWQIGAAAGWTPVTNLLIRPEIRYTANGAGVSAWDGVLRFQRSF